MTSYMIPELSGCDECTYRNGACEQENETKLENSKQELSEACDRLVQAICDFASCIVEILVPIFKATVDHIIAFWKTLLVAVADADPKWLHYYRYSKKKRVRKKYYNKMKKSYSISSDDYS